MDQKIRDRSKMGRLNRRPILFIELLSKGALFFIILICAACYYPSLGICDIASSFNRKGLAEMQKGNFREALVYFESAHSSDPSDTNIHKNLSACYHHFALQKSSRKDWSAAIRDEKNALRYDSDNKIIREQLGIFYNNYALEYANKGKYAPAQENLEEALKLSPESETIEINLYNIMLQYADSSYKKKNSFKARKLAKKAIRLKPEVSPAYIFLGNMYYQSDNFTDALKYWKKAIAIEPDNKDLQQRIAKLKRESSVEGDFYSRRRSHFKIRFDKELGPDYAAAISDILEDGRRRVRSEFNLYSDEVIPVIVYSDEQFADVTSMPYWTAGLYDGKIRFKEQDISRGDDAMRRVLYHEYGHAVIYINYGNGVPSWLHEGFAQINEPEQLLSNADKKFLSTYINREGPFSLEQIDSMFGQRENADMARAAYLESRLFLEYLIERYRKHKLKRLFEELKAGKDWHIAIREIYGKSIDRLNSDFRRRLTKILNT